MGVVLLLSVLLPAPVGAGVPTGSGPAPAPVAAPAGGGMASGQATGRAAGRVEPLGLETDATVDGLRRPGDALPSDESAAGPGGLAADGSLVAPMAPLTGTATAVAVGISHACALLSDGTVACWGWSGNGQLGTGIGLSPLPVAVPGVANAIAIAAGNAHTCALLTGGSILCWGWNQYGQLGNASTTDSGSAVSVTGITNAIAITAAGAHTCAVLSGGTIRCWGTNANGELGNGSYTNSSVPVAVSGVTTATAVSAGTWHTCARLSGGAVQCWGRNHMGQLGNGALTDSSLPVTVMGLPGGLPGQTATAIAASQVHSCAIVSDGSVRCWGGNLNSELGNGSAVQYSASPVQVSLAGTATTIASRYSHTCVTVTGGGLRCWGFNGNGELGDGTVINRSTPVAVIGIAVASQVAMGQYSACAVLAAGGVGCWGWDGDGQLGNGTATAQPLPVQVEGISTAVQVSTGAKHACAVLSGGTVKCWGDNTYGQLGNGTTTSSSVPVTVTGITSATRVSAGARSTCANVALPSGHIECWGDDTYGQLSNGGAGSSLTPVDIDPIISAGWVSVGDFHACASSNLTNVQCWGLTDWGQAGAIVPGNVLQVRAYVVGPGLGVGNVETVAAGAAHTCAVVEPAHVACWGSNQDGQLGQSTSVAYSTSAVTAPLGGNPTAVASGGRHTCALVSPGNVLCWGDNATGQLGTGSTGAGGPTPVSVSGITTAVTVGAGANHTCAVLTGGSITCWGGNGWGQIGDGTFTTAPLPVTVSGISTATQVDGGWYFTCAVLTGGTISCWGANDRGQAGNGMVEYSATPLRVVGFGAPVAPGAPGTPSGVPVNRGVTVSWPNPAADGGAPITAFTATSNPGGHTCTTALLSCTVTGLDNGTPYTFTVTATNSAGASGASNTSASVSPTGATYVAVTPNRLLDTRNGNGFQGPLQVGRAKAFQVTGRNPGSPALNVPANAVAVTGNLTVTAATAAGWLSLTPVEDNNPPTSTVNFPVGDNRANGVTVPIGPGGILAVVYNGPAAGNTTHAIFDVTGYFLPDLTGATYVKLTPNRLLDSRIANGFSGPLVQGVSRSFQVTGRNLGNANLNVPSNAIAVTGNLTVTLATQAGWVSITPNLDNSPGTSTLNFPAGDNRANGVTAPLGTGGILSLAYNSSYCCNNTVHVVFDVTGYFVPGTSGAKFQPIIPNRLLDSRSGNGFAGALSVGVSRSFAVTDRHASSYWFNVPSDAIAVTGNLTVTSQTAAGWLTLTPTQDNNPPTSTLNFPVGDDRANGVAAPLGSGLLWVAYNGPSAGNTANAIFDVTGYFVP